MKRRILPTRPSVAATAGPAAGVRPVPPAPSVSGEGEPTTGGSARTPLPASPTGEDRGGKAEGLSPTQPLAVKPWLQRYARELARFGRASLLAALLWMLAVGLLESVGLLLLVPLLGLIGLVQTHGADLVALLDRAFALLGARPTLPGILVVYVALVGLRGLALRQRELTVTQLHLGWVDHLRERLFSSLSHAEWTFLNRTRAADITHILTADLPRVGQGTQATLQLLASLVLALAHLAAALALSVPLTALALVVGGAMLLAARREQRGTLAAGGALSEAQRKVYLFISEFLGALKLAKSHGVETEYLAEWRGCLHAVRQQQFAFIHRRATSQLLFQIGMALALALVIYCAVVGLAAPPARLLVIVFIFARLLPMIDALHRNYQQHLYMLPAFAAVCKLETRCGAAAEPPAAAAAAPFALNQGVRLRDIRFRYHPAQASPVLALADLWLPTRRITAIVGPSGAGKSTLADVLCGLLRPDSGDLTVDGRPLDGEIRRAWRRQIAYVPQEVFLFHDTIRANLAWANPAVDEATLWRALRQVAADEFVRRLPDGLDTRVGERGIRLSGGERQRIALARALLRRPLLLILDEATSALDSEHEERIRDALARLHGELTLVIIAHRLSTVRHADQIVVLEAGRIVEQGDWDTLVARPEGRLRALLAAEGRTAPAAR